MTCLGRTQPASQSRSRPFALQPEWPTAQSLGASLVAIPQTWFTLLTSRLEKLIGSFESNLHIDRGTHDSRRQLASSGFPTSTSHGPFHQVRPETQPVVNVVGTPYMRQQRVLSRPVDRSNISGPNCGSDHSSCPAQRDTALAASHDDCQVFNQAGQPWKEVNDRPGLTCNHSKC